MNPYYLMAVHDLSLAHIESQSDSDDSLTSNEVKVIVNKVAHSPSRTKPPILSLQMDVSFRSRLRGEIMSFQASWIHGNALTVENPENLNRVGHFGWGADMDVKHGKSSWFHIALPTPVIVAGARSKLIRVFLMFKSEVGSIRNVHVYDGLVQGAGVQ